MMTGRYRVFTACALIWLSAHSGYATARTFLVGLGGAGGGCTHSSLTAAISAAASNPGPDEIRLIQGMADSGQAIQITGQDLTITGGYENCADPDVGLERTVVSGLGGTAAPVIRIRGPGVVRLENLHIVSGDATIDGGGINYTGSATSNSVNALFLARTVVEANQSTGNGGGLLFVGSSDRVAELILEQDTGFFRNIAGENGGAIYITGNARLSGEAQRLFFWENAAQTGNGGALNIEAPATADIGSATWLGEATFLRNVAGVDGGAIHVDARQTTESSMVRLYSILPDQPLTLANNSAGSNGGAISILGNLNDSSNNASVCVRSINILSNTAGDGAALRVTKGEYGYCAGTQFPASAVVACVPQAACGRVSGNQASGAFAQSSVVRMFGAQADFRETSFDGNSVEDEVLLLGEYVAPTIRRGSSIALVNSLIVGNTLPLSSSAAMQIDAGGNATVMHSTISGNSPGSRAIAASGSTASPRVLLVFNSIIYQPGGPAVQLLPSEVTLSHLLLHEIPSGQEMNSTLRIGNPLFLNGWRLAPNSPAVDFAPNIGLRFDKDVNPRPIDLGSHSNLFGPADLGAFEVQFAQAGEIFANGYEDED